MEIKTVLLNKRRSAEELAEMATNLVPEGYKAAIGEFVLALVDIEREDANARMRKERDTAQNDLRVLVSDIDGMAVRNSDLNARLNGLKEYVETVQRERDKAWGDLGKLRKELDEARQWTGERESELTKEGRCTESTT